MGTDLPAAGRNAVAKPAPVHWLRGGSVADRVVACPGYPNLATQYPADPPSEPAIEGTHDHTVLELCVKQGIWDADHFRNRFLQDHDGEFLVNADRAGRVNMALGYVQQRLNQLPSHTVVLSETFVNAGSPYGVPDWGGSADLMFVHQNGWEVADYKGGYGLVEPTSHQLHTYAVGLINRYPGLIGKPGRKTILQPKRFKQANYVDVTYDEFQDQTRILVNAMRASMQPDAPRIPGDHCKYCRGARTGRCPEWNERRANQQTEAISIVTDMTTTNNAPALDGGAFAIESIGPHTPDARLAGILDAEPIITEMIKEAKAEALRRSIAGTKFPGRKLIQETSRESWVEGAEAKLEAAKVLAAKDMFKPVLRTPKQIRETEGYQKLGPKRRERVEELVKPSTKVYRLVLESDRGKAITTGLSSEQLQAAASTPPSLPEVETPAPETVPEPVHTPISFF